jgi:hypothetical protein
LILMTIKLGIRIPERRRGLAAMLAADVPL